MFEADLEDRRVDRGGAGDSGDAPDGGGGPPAAGGGGVPPSAAPAGRKTLETVSAADAIVDALDMAAHEAEGLREFAAARAAASAAAGPGASAAAAAAAALAVRPPAPNPLLLGLSPGAFVLRALTGVRANDLETALLLLPFVDALQLLAYLPAWLRGGTQARPAAHSPACALARLRCRASALLPRCRPRRLFC